MDRYGGARIIRSSLLESIASRTPGRGEQKQNSGDGQFVADEGLILAPFPLSAHKEQWEERDIIYFHFAIFFFLLTCCECDVHLVKKGTNVRVLIFG